MSIRIMTVVWPMNLRATEKIVLLALADNASDEGVCWPSIDTLMKKCCLSERCIQGVITRLCDGGHLTIQGRTGRSNYYVVHPVVSDDPTPARGAPPPPHVVHPTPARGAPPPPHVVHPTPARGAPITVIEPPSESKSQRARSRSRRAPADFQPDLEYAKAQLPDIDVEREAQKMRDWEFKTPRSDWQAVWRNWIERCRETGKYAKKVNAYKVLTQADIDDPRGWR